MRRYFLVLLVFSAVLPLTQACVQAQPHGALLIKADTTNQVPYSIYRIAANKPLQLLARHQGTYNHQLSLPASEYLVLADCSHAKVQIKAGQLTELHALHLEFVPLPQVQKSYFPLQCSQFEALDLRQSFRNKFRFWLLKPQVNLRIAAKPLAIDFKDKHYLRYDLSALRVGANAQAQQTRQKEDYFIYPQGNLLAVTKRQQVGQWISLLAGEYVVEFNGTSITVSLQAREQLTLPTASLVIAANNASVSDVALFNTGKTIYYNQPFITLPTTLRLSLHRTSLPLTLKLTDAMTITARSIVLVPPCVTETACQEQHLQFFLYEQGEKIPFVSAKIGERVFFARANVSVAIEGTQGITYRLPDSNRDTVFKLGKLKVNYSQHRNSKRYTDLLRLEAQGRSMTGNSMDLRFGGEHGTLLIAGRYRVAHYVSEVSEPNKASRVTRGSGMASEAQGNQRHRYLHPLRIIAGQTTVHRQKIIARN